MICAEQPDMEMTEQRGNGLHDSEKLLESGGQELEQGGEEGSILVDLGAMRPTGLKLTIVFLPGP